MDGRWFYPWCLRRGDGRAVVLSLVSDETLRKEFVVLLVIVHAYVKKWL